MYTHGWHRQQPCVYSLLQDGEEEAQDVSDRKARTLQQIVDHTIQGTQLQVQLPQILQQTQFGWQLKSGEERNSKPEVTASMQARKKIETHRRSNKILWSWMFIRTGWAGWKQMLYALPFSFTLVNKDILSYIIILSIYTCQKCACCFVLS